MNLKFNFYDVYGFALPGFLLVAVLWLPFALIENKWPDAEFSSALVGIILAYVVGHVLQTVAHHAIPSTLPTGRHPSSQLLDPDDPTFTFSREFKRRLANQINTIFELNVSPDTLSTNLEALKTVDRVRRDAFFLCRSALIKSKTVIYAEQFEGLYALMRGLSAAFAVGVVYYLGWVYSTVWSMPWSGLLLMVGIVVAAFAGERLRRDPRDSVAKNLMRGALLLSGFAAGYYLGQSRIGTTEHRGHLIAAAVFSFFAAERCFSGYRYFANEFAKAVYRDFSNYEKPAAVNGPAAGNEALAEDESEVED